LDTTGQERRKERGKGEEREKGKERKGNLYPLHVPP
jgi:hypothetical protein